VTAPWRLAKLLVVALSLSCVHNVPAADASREGGDFPARRVKGHMQWVSMNQVPPRYRRVSDIGLVGSYNILIADDGDYCVVTDWDYLRTRDGQQFACEWHKPQ
jgi:DUF971 family protein